MKDFNVISLVDQVAANPDNRDVVREFLNKRDAINAFRAYPDGRDTGAVAQSDGEILESLDKGLAQALRSGDLQDLDRETYDAWLTAVDAGHDVPLVGYDAYEFSLQLEAEEARRARSEELARRRANHASQDDDGGNQAAQDAVDALRRQFREEHDANKSGGFLNGLRRLLPGKSGADHNTLDAE